MKINKLLLFIMVVFAQLPACVFAQKVTKIIKDKETGQAVSFAIIKSISDASIHNLAEADVDGRMTIEVTTGSTYTIFRLGYKPITLTAEQLLLDEIIIMEMLPYELSTVVVTPDTALRDIYRALDSTHKHIPATPFFRRLYHNEQIISENDTLLDAKSIIDIKVVKVRAAGKGTMIVTSLKGLRIYYSNSENIRPFQNKMSISNINQFSISSIDVENVAFNRINSENDSITIISFHPKNYFTGVVYKTGRLIIDKRTWIIRRIDMTFDNTSIEYLNHQLTKAESRQEKVIHEIQQSLFFSANGLPFKIEEKINYCLSAEPEEIYTWTFLQVYKDISKADFQRKPSKKYDLKKNIFQQKPVTMPDFDSQFNQGFQ